MKKALTINVQKTKAKIKADGRTVASWGRLRGFTAGTVQLIFNGRYPHTEKLESEYQKILRTLEADEYLVQSDPEESSTKAA